MSLASRIHGAHQHQQGRQDQHGHPQGLDHSREPGQGREQHQDHLVEQDGGQSRDQALPANGRGSGHGWHGSGHLHGHGGGHARAHGNADTAGITLDHSRSYDTFVNAFFAGRRPAIFRKLAELSGAAPGDRALDVGCGTGYLTSKLAEVVAPDGSVTGVDASAAMVAEASRLRSSAGCTYTVGAAERLEFEDGRFDVVTSSLMLHHLPTELRVPALHEMRRVLRPGGRLLIAEFRPPRTGLGRHVVGSITGPAMMEDQRPLLPGLFREAGFATPRTGDLRPWITYAIAVRD